ncbi:HTH-type transcriptional regulator CdhR [uncultured bacterium]|nr:HTH-type transcriptional regulator CdhR [uncultured bacterium]
MKTKHLMPHHSPKVRRIAVFAYTGVENLDIGGPMEVFAFANLILHLQGLSTEPAYIIEVLAEQAGIVRTLSGMQIVADKAYLEANDDIDTLIISGGFIPAEFFPSLNLTKENIFKQPMFLAWLRFMSKRVRRLASVCTGAFALAECGLLNGMRATTHWDFCQRLSTDFPEIKVEPNQIFIQDGNIYTSGGITSGIDLALAMLEEDWGHDVALAVARYLVVYLKRPGGQSQFSNYLAVEAAHRPDFRELQTYIMDHPAEDHRVEVLASRMCMSTRNFSRLFTAQTSTTPAKYVEMVRIDAARHYLETTDLSIEVIAEKVGFFDPERMRRSFLRQLGVNPKNYRDCFNRTTE